MLSEFGEIEFMGIPSDAEQAFDGWAGLARNSVKVVFVTFGAYKRARQTVGPFYGGACLFY